MNPLTKLVTGFAIVLTILVLIFTIANNASNNACKELGYKEHVRTQDFSFCRDQQDNLHYVTGGWEIFPYDAWVKEISVGDVRVK